MDKKLTEIIVPSSGKSTWMGGAYVIAFVYSNKGNFVLKGYMQEVQDRLSKMKNEGLKYYANFTLWQRGQFRSILYFYKDSVGIYGPSKWDRTWNKNTRRFKVYQRSPMFETNPTKKEFYFKRLPKTWIPLFDQL